MPKPPSKPQTVFKCEDEDEKNTKIEINMEHKAKVDLVDTLKLKETKDPTVIMDLTQQSVLNRN